MRLNSSQSLIRVSLKLFLLFALMGMVWSVSVAAQQQQQTPVEQNNPALPETQQQAGVQANDPINLIQELNLTPDQQAQLRALKEEHAMPIREALKRRNRAQRSLQEAIYAEQADEPTIQARTHELSEAQADLARLRTTVELRIRHILTPEQLQRFREIRQQRWQRGRAALRQNRELQRQRKNQPNAGTSANEQRNNAAQNRQMQRDARQQMRQEKRLERQANRQPRQSRPIKPAQQRPKF